MPDYRRIQIGEWTLDPSRNLITSGSAEVSLEPLAAKVLEYLASVPGQTVSVEELTDAVWNRPFVGDSPVYRLIAELRRALGDDAREPAYIETVRKRGYRLIAAVSSTGDAAVSPPTDSSTRPRLRVPLAIVSTVAALAIAWLATRPSRQPVESLVVIPLQDVSADGGRRYIAESITEILIHELAQIPGLAVEARTTSLAFKDNPMDVREIGQMLGVDALLEGSVQWSGDTARVTVQLIDARSGRHFWSRPYEVDDVDRFPVQDRIVADVVDALVETMQPANGSAEEPPALRPSDPAAVESYVLGRQALATASYESLPRAKRHFEQALEIDPDLNLARFSLMDTRDAMMAVGMTSYRESFPTKAELAKEILAHDPGSARAMVHLAFVDFGLNFPFGSGDARQYFERAIEIAPRDAIVASSYAYTLRYLDRSEEAKRVLDRALELDPLSVRLLRERSKHGSLEHAERLKRYYPANPAGWATAGRTYVAGGRLADAVEEFRVAERLSPGHPDYPAWIGMILMSLDLLEQARDPVERAKQKGPGSPLSVAVEAALLHRSGQPARAGELALGALSRNLYPRQFSSFALHQIGLEHAVASGQAGHYVELLSRWLDFSNYKNRRPSGPMRTLFDDTTSCYTDYLNKNYAAVALIAAGQEERARGLIAANRDFLQNASEAYRDSTRDYELYVAAGEMDQALGVMEEILSGDLTTSIYTVDEGVAILSWLRFNDRFAGDLTRDPRFGVLLEEHDRRLAAERQAVARLFDAPRGEPSSASSPESSPPASQLR